MAEGGAYGPSQTHGLESPCHVAWDGRRRVGWRRTERTARPKPTGWKARATWHGTDGGRRRAEGGAYGPSQTHGLESLCHVAWAFQPMSGRPRIAPVAYSCARDLAADGWRRAERTARPQPTGWKARATWGRGGGLTLFLKDLPVL